MSAVSVILALYLKFPFILDRNSAKANGTENHVCASCDIVILGIKYFTITMLDIKTVFSISVFLEERDLFSVVI